MVIIISFLILFLNFCLPAVASNIQCASFPGLLPVNCVSSASYASTDLIPNVGIGTATPQATLHVFAPTTQTVANFEDNSGVSFLIDSFANWHFTNDNQIGGWFDNNYGHDALSTQGGNDMYVTTNANGASGGNIFIIPNVGGNTAIGTTTARETLDTGPSGTIDTNTVNSSAATLALTAQNGITLSPTGAGTLVELTAGLNMGIGSTNPGVLLDVASQIRSTTGSAFLPSFVAGTQNNTGIFSPAASAVSVTSNGVEMARFINGNLGVGSTVPGQVLDVQGTVRTTGFTLTGNGAASGFILQSNGSLGIGTWVPEPTGGGSTSAAGGLNAVQYNSPIGTLAGKENIFSFNGTQIGIGTTNGRNLFDVEGTVTTAALEITPVGNVGIGSLNPGQMLDVGGMIRSTAVGNSTFNGNVGINSAAPGQSLDVSGTVRASGSISSTGTGNVLVTGNVGIGTTLSVNPLDVNGQAAIGATYAGYNTAPTNGIIIQGNEGIGTPAPTGKLEIEGGNIGVGTYVQPEMLSVGGGVVFNGNLAGGVTGNIGIGTTQTVAGATCDSSCNTAGKRCVFGLKTVTVGIEPCSVSIVGDCVCLNAT